MSSALDTHIVNLVMRIESDEGEIGVLSTGERIAVAVVLDRKTLLPDWFGGDWDAAVDRLGREWFDACKRVADTRGMASKKKASGVNIPEAQRGTVQVKLRLPIDVAEALDELAERHGLTRSGMVAKLVEAHASTNAPPSSTRR